MLKRFLSYQRSRRSAQLGFTLIELLVAMIISGLIVTGLLYMVVELLSVDNRESARTATQRDGQLALDYITEELREAVYVYDNIEKLTGTGAFSRRDRSIPDFGADFVPILAFWKPVDLDLSNAPANLDCSNPAADAWCDLLGRRRGYSLVVYYQSTANPNNVWEGESRIMRYELSEFDNGNTPDGANPFNYTEGYVNPVGPTLDGAGNLVGFSSFEYWPYTANPDDANVSSDNLQTAIPPGPNPATLIDFVDSPQPIANINPPEATPIGPTFAANYANGNFCPNTLGGDITGDGNPDPLYQLSTNDPTQSSFFACVRANAQSRNVNQDVYVFFRANARGRTRNDVLLPLSTQVLVRGVDSK